MTNREDKNTSYEKDFVIGGLLESSKEFKAFYDAERPKITQKIEWIEGKSLPEGSPAKYGHFDEYEGVIKLRRIPAKVEDAMIIAHELQHAVVRSQGFPATRKAIGADNKYIGLSTAFNSMIHDSLVNKALQNYGFDLLEDFTKLKNKSLDELIEAPSPTSDSDKTHYVFNYVNNILLWEIIGAEKDNKFQKKFESLYPELANEGQELLALIKSVGYDTPEKMRILIREIITRYKLSDYILEVD
jgi:hypothetical protein